MSGKKGMHHYSRELKEKVRAENRAGVSQMELSRKYEISGYAIQSWCGMRPEVELRQASPLPKGRPRKNAETMEQEINRLRMENELLRNFLLIVGKL